MTKEEFYKLFGKPEKYVKEFKEATKIKEVVFVKFVYDKTLYATKKSLPEDYKIKMMPIWQNAVSKELEKPEKEIIEEALKKSKITKEILKHEPDLEIEAEIKIMHQLNGYKIYVVFTISKEALYLYFGNRYKRKVIIFLKDGILELKYPPFDIKDNFSPIGKIGIETKLTEKDCIEICEK